MIVQAEAALFAAEQLRRLASRIEGAATNYAKLRSSPVCTRKADVYRIAAEILRAKLAPGLSGGEQDA